MARHISRAEKFELEKGLAIEIIRRRGGKWRRKTPRKEETVSVEEVVAEIMRHPSYAISFDKHVTRVIINLENVYGQAYEQIIFEKI